MGRLVCCQGEKVGSPLVLESHRSGEDNRKLVDLSNPKNKGNNKEIRRVIKTMLCFKESKFVRPMK